MMQNLGTLAPSCAFSGSSPAWRGIRPSLLRSYTFRVTFLYVPGWWFTLSLGPAVCSPLRSYTFLLRSFTFRSRRVQMLLSFPYVPIRSGTPYRCLERCTLNNAGKLQVMITFLHVPPMFLNRLTNCRHFMFTFLYVPLRSFTFRSGRIEISMFFLYVPIRSGQQYRRYAPKQNTFAPALLNYLRGVSGCGHIYIYIYIYIEREREGERERERERERETDRLTDRQTSI